MKDAEGECSLKARTINTFSTGAIETTAFLKVEPVRNREQGEVAFLIGTLNIDSFSKI